MAGCALQYTSALHASIFFHGTTSDAADGAAAAAAADVAAGVTIKSRNEAADEDEIASGAAAAAAAARRFSSTQKLRCAVISATDAAETPSALDAAVAAAARVAADDASRAWSACSPAICRRFSASTAATVLSKKRDIDYLSLLLEELPFARRRA